MKLNKIVVQNFRSYLQEVFEFSDGVNVVVGKNTAGKTNLLEAVYLLSAGDSFREGKIDEMVKWEGDVAHIQGKIDQNSEIRIQKSERLQGNSSEDKGNSVELQVTLTRGVVNGKRVAKRRLMVNGVGRRKDKFIENFYAVVFRPEDLRIVEGSPGRRRKFMDEVLSQVDGEYARSLKSYTKGLRRRNKVLEAIREGRTNRRSLLFWDQLVVKNGSYIQDRRRELVKFFNSNKQQETSDKIFFSELRMVLDESVMSEKRLEQYAGREVAAGHTLVGPHRDDFGIVNNKQKTVNNEGKDLAKYGSRGEQRLGVLWLKMRSLEFVGEKAGVKPCLLLDDIYSELDDENREMVMKMVSGHQTIITSADVNNVEKHVDEEWKIIMLGARG